MNLSRWSAGLCWDGLIWSRAVVFLALISGGGLKDQVVVVVAHNGLDRACGDGGDSPAWSCLTISVGVCKREEGATNNHKYLLEGLFHNPHSLTC